MKRPLHLPFALALALGASQALALGLGPVQVKSRLNQPLDAEIPVLQGSSGEAEGLLVTLASPEDFDRVGISRGKLTVPLQFKVVKGAQGPVIKVTSSEPIRDTYLSFLVEANWPNGRLLREYSVLIDPPGTAPASRVVATAPVTGRATTQPIATEPAITTTPESVAVEPATPAQESKPLAEPSKPAKPAKPAREPKPSPEELAEAREKPGKMPPPKAEPKSETPPADAVAKADEPKPETAPTEDAPKPIPAPAAAQSSGGGEYGPVRKGEALSTIARAQLPAADINVNQMMVALLRTNPKAFYKNNVNALKSGAILRIPSADDVRSTASAREAAAEIRAHIEDWRGVSAAASPTRIADAGSSSAPFSTGTPGKTTGVAGTSDSRLELVPPKVGKDSLAMNDRPGSGQAGSAATAELKAELARTKEALTAREHEAGDLKSRVKELEDMKGKNDRLISLKDSEIAELQRKLEEARKGVAGKPVAEPVKPVAAASEPVKTEPVKTTPKKDIFDDTPPTPATTPASSAIATTPTAPSPSTPSATSASSTSPAVTPPATPSTTTTPTASPATAPTPPTGATTATPTTGNGATVTPLPETTTPAPVPPKPKPVPPKPATAPAPAVAVPWYDPMWVKLALGAAALAGIFGILLVARRRRGTPAVVTPARGSIADAFGHESVPAAAATAMPSTAEEIATLRQQISRDPYNAGLYLELLSLYYTERDVANFEATAADMHHYVSDADQLEWQEAQAMGRELAPDNPLFSMHGHHAAAAPTRSPIDEFAFDDDFAPPATASPTTMHSPPAARGPDLSLGDDESFAFGSAASNASASASSSRMDDSFSFDDLPPLEPVAPVRSAPIEVHVPPSASADIHVHVPPKAASDDIRITPGPVFETKPVTRSDDDFFAGEDAVGTKLDLAKAYMDMGDPDGARSMLEEVVAEGNDSQRAEAHRLIAELR